MLPSQFDKLPIREKAFVIASIKIKVEKEIDEQKKLKKKR
jgi:hypothetical protein